MSSKLTFHSLNYFEAGLRPGIISSVNILVVILKDKNSLQNYAALVFTCKCMRVPTHTSNNSPCVVWSAVSLHPSQEGNASNFHEMKLWSYFLDAEGGVSGHCQAPVEEILPYCQKRITSILFPFYTFISSWVGPPFLWLLTNQW